MTEGELLGARRLREICARHGVRPTKVLGQNFVIDPNTIRKVVDVSGVAGSDHVLEIGAGAGSLTTGLARAGGRVTALEVDASLLPVLAETVGPLDNVDLVHADALRADLGSFGASKLVANLPYNVAVPLIMRALETAPSLEEMVVMTQREVGERLAARPGSKAYGQVSVLAAYFAAARVVTQVSRRAFWPVPNVDSVLVRLVRRPTPDVSYERLARIVKAAFAQRRKTLRKALAGAVSDPDALLGVAGVAAGARGEELDLDTFVRLARTEV